LRRQWGALRWISTPRAKYHVAGECSLHALLPGRHSAISVSSRAGAGRRLQGAAQPLLDLRQQGRGKPVERHARNGQSRPWQDALEKIAGSRQMDATAIRDYFAPLQKWLDEQNRGKPLGW